jgi:hypothetical protein
VCDWMLRVAKKDEVCRWSFSRGGRVGSVYVRDGWRRAVGGKWSPQVPSQTGEIEECGSARCHRDSLRRVHFVLTNVPVGSASPIASHVCFVCVEVGCQ